MLIVEVVLFKPFFFSLDYLWKEECQPKLGMRIIAPLGKSEQVAIIIRIKQQSTVKNLKSVIRVLDEVTFLDKKFLAFLNWISRYYHYPFGKVVFFSLPTLLRKERLLTDIKQQTAHYTTPKICLPKEKQLSFDKLIAACKKTPLKPIFYHQTIELDELFYKKIVIDILRQKKQVLILVAERVQTTYLASFFKKDFPKLAIFHSGLTAKKSLEIWQKIQLGEVNLLIGTRSAVFIPFPQLGLMIVNQEHQAAFKAFKQGFSYHARNVAIKRAYDFSIPILLTSESPSLVTLNHINAKRYREYPDPKKPFFAANILVQNTKNVILEAGLAQPVLDLIQEKIDKKQNILLFLNKKGYADVLLCRSCGWIARCEKCNSKMRYYAEKQKIHCHACHYEINVMQHCSACHSKQLSTRGIGTERLRLTLGNYFSNVAIICIDQDHLTTKKQLKNQFQQLEKQKSAIIIGTRLVLQQPVLSNLGLVCFLNIDQFLLSSRYQIVEKFAQLIVRLSRLLRQSGKKGELVLQTCYPEQAQLRSLLLRGYIKFANELLDERKIWNYPPFSYQILIKAKAPIKQVAFNFLQKIKITFSENSDSKVDIFEPKNLNDCQSQLLLASTYRSDLHQLVDLMVQYMIGTKKIRYLHWEVDVDPVDAT